MEFFEIDVKTSRLITSPQIWIYFVTAVAVTVFTMVLYYVMAGVPNIRKREYYFGGKPEDQYVPRSLQKTSTDVEKNPKILAP
jgi:hypothetical protein